MDKEGSNGERALDWVEKNADRRKISSITKASFTVQVSIIPAKQERSGKKNKLSLYHL